jgi:hypothetical protein
VPASGQSPRLVTEDVNRGGGGDDGGGVGGGGDDGGDAGGDDDGMLPTNCSPFRSSSAIAVMQVPPFLSYANLKRTAQFKHSPNLCPQVPGCIKPRIFPLQLPATSLSRCVSFIVTNYSHATMYHKSPRVSQHRSIHLPSLFRPRVLTHKMLSSTTRPPRPAVYLPENSLGLLHKESTGALFQAAAAFVVLVCGSGRRSLNGMQLCHRRFVVGRQGTVCRSVLIHNGAKFALHKCAHTAVLERHSSWCRAIQVSTSPRSHSTNLPMSPPHAHQS